ncbi:MULTISPECIES: PspC domain-containing protein [unclassified Pseudoalteromonas]|uniref:PspC domain-containing protein n=1 Tax=unclassified Pseudoalteromonas TaxID=194690 RepID=UPI001409BEAC|nr:MULTISPECIES: PspC domain-containing protein [unclassified Pseudoalteromonas]MBH0026677.1 PspC domain-containing protein [Pseudoalteromonas sp. SWN29]MBH0038318.1 PspC domain-containing protein [Pseudoalteromonas sp. SWN166]
MNSFNRQRGWYKDTLNKKISGVCSGLAHRLDFPVWATRVVTILLFLSFPFAIALGYFIAHCCLEDKVY